MEKVQNGFLFIKMSCNIKLLFMLFVLLSIKGVSFGGQEAIWAEFNQYMAQLAEYSEKYKTLRGKAELDHQGFGMEYEGSIEFILTEDDVWRASVEGTLMKDGVENDPPQYKNMEYRYKGSAELAYAPDASNATLVPVDREGSALNRLVVLPGINTINDNGMPFEYSLKWFSPKRDGIFVERSEVQNNITFSFDFSRDGRERGPLTQIFTFDNSEGIPVIIKYHVTSKPLPGGEVVKDFDVSFCVDQSSGLLVPEKSRFVHSRKIDREDLSCVFDNKTKFVEFEVNSAISESESQLYLPKGIDLQNSILNEVTTISEDQVILEQLLAGKGFVSNTIHDGIEDRTVGHDKDEIPKQNPLRIILMVGGFVLVSSGFVYMLVGSSKNSET